MTTYFHRYYGFDKLTSYLYLHQGQYDAQAGKVYDESFFNGDARDVQVGRAYQFDGVDSYVTGGLSFNSTFSSKPKILSIGCWFNAGTGNQPNGVCWLVGPDVAFGSQGLVITIRSSGEIRLNAGDREGNQAAIETSSQWNDGNWHWVIGEFENGDIRLYIDDEISPVESQSGVGFTEVGLPGNSVTFGGRGSSSSNFYEGLLFAPFIHNAILTDTEKAEYGNGELDWTKILRLWSIDEGNEVDVFEKNAEGVGTINNADLSQFHHESGDVPFSFQNKLGYTYDQANDRYIPRNEAQPEQDVQGNALQFSGKVPFDVVAKGSNCGYFEGNHYADTGMKMNFVHQTGDFRIIIQDIVSQNILNLNTGERFVIVGNGYESESPGFYVSAEKTSSGYRYRLELSDDNNNNQVCVTNPFSEILPRRVEFIGNSADQTVKVAVDGNIIGDRTVSYTPQGQIDAYDIVSIGVVQNTNSRNYEGLILNLSIKNPNNSNDDFEYTMSEGGRSDTLFDRINSHDATINADLQTFWSQTQNVFHANLKNGHDLWQHDSSGEYMRVPLRDDGSSILGENDSKSGYTWVSKHLPANKFHNRAETVFDTEADNPLHYQLKQATGMAGIHPDNVYPSDQFFKKQLDKAEARKFTGYFAEQTGKRLTKTQNFVK